MSTMAAAWTRIKIISISLMWLVETHQHFGMGTSNVGRTEQILPRSNYIGPDGTAVHLLWRRNLGSRLSSISIAANGKHLIGSASSGLIALDAATGDHLWAYRTGASATTTPATDLKGSVYVGGSDGNLYALDVFGTLTWGYNTGAPVLSVVAASSLGIVYAISQGQILYALDAASGTLMWRVTVGGAVDIPPVVSLDGTLYVNCADNNMHALDAITGASKWTYSIPHSAAHDSVGINSIDGTVLFSSGNTLHAVDGATGSGKWMSTADASMSNGVLSVGSDGTLYIGTADNRLYALDGSTGATKWTSALGASMQSTAALAADGTVYVVTADDMVHALDGTTGSTLWNFAAGVSLNSAPMIGASGVAYVASEHGHVFALLDPRSARNQGGTARPVTTPVAAPVPSVQNALQIPAERMALVSPNPTISSTPTWSKTNSRSESGTAPPTISNSVPASFSTTKTSTRSPSFSRSSANTPVNTGTQTRTGSYTVTSSRTVTATLSSSQTQTSTQTPTSTSQPSLYAIPAVTPAAVLRSQDVCGTAAVLPAWLYGSGPAGLGYTVGFSNAAQFTYTGNPTDGSLLYVKVDCQTSWGTLNGSTTFIRAATSTDVFNGAGIAGGTCSTAKGNLSAAGNNTAYDICNFGGGTDAGTCTTHATGCLHVAPFVQQQRPPAIPWCALHRVIPAAFIGSGEMVPVGQNSGRFPPNVLVIDAQSITVISYGVDPMRAAAPSAYQIGSISSFCASYATSSSIGASQTAVLVVPSLIALGTDCIYAILPAVENASPQFFYGLLNGSRCDPVLPAWQLTSWVARIPDPPVPEPASAFPLAAAAAIGVVVPLAVLAAVAVVWMLKRGGRPNKPMSSMPVAAVNPLHASADERSGWTPNPVTGASAGSSV